MALTPLTRSRADQRRFVDRAEETRAAVDAVQSGQPVLLLGAPGSGRTSLLGHIAYRLGRRRESILVSGEVAGSAAQLLGVLVARLYRLADPAPPRARWVQELRALTFPDGPFGDVVAPAVLMELVDLVGERLDALPRPVCLMVDGVAPRVAHELFGSLRNELWTLERASWIVTGDSDTRALYLEPPADAFFERVIELGPLSRADARKLLRAHLPELTEDEMGRAVTAGGGNPRRLLRAAAEIRAGGEPAAPESDRLADAARTVGGPLAARLVRYLADTGPAAASDAQLLRQLGASRQRVSQLMHQLQSAGLLETIEQHEPGRRGRPARRFAIKTSP